jgi:hypothetical protein
VFWVLLLFPIEAWHKDIEGCSERSGLKPLIFIHADWWKGSAFIAPSMTSPHIWAQAPKARKFLLLLLLLLLFATAKAQSSGDR